VSSEGQLAPRERQTLAALRYAVNDEAASYLAIRRLFTTGMTGFLSDQSAAEVTERLAEQGIALDHDTVKARLSYLVEHGNLARSPRETEARSNREYLTNRSRYQLTQRGELVHRQVEELLEHTDQAREVSSEMLPGILDGLERLRAVVASGVGGSDPRELAGRSEASLETTLVEAQTVQAAPAMPPPPGRTPQPGYSSGSPASLSTPRSACPEHYPTRMSH
jgi:hypothetical protein